MPKQGSNPNECEFCGYSLSGLSSGLCPECGRPVFRFTDRARQVIALANSNALELMLHADPLQRASKWRLPHRTMSLSIHPCHVLLAIACGPHGVGYHAIASTGSQPESLRREVMARLPIAPPRSLAQATRLPLSRSTRRLVRTAINEALSLSHTWTGTEHLLLAICRRGDSVSRRSLSARSISYNQVRAFVVANLAAACAAKSNPERGGQH